MATTIHPQTTPPIDQRAPSPYRNAATVAPQISHGRSAAVEAIALVALTTIAFFAFGAAVTWWAAGDAVGSIAVGAFGAFWGGVGFGVMFAGIRWFADHPDH